MSSKEAAQPSGALHIMVLKTDRLLLLYAGSLVYVLLVVVVSVSGVLEATAPLATSTRELFVAGERYQSSHHLCILGNAESAETARVMNKQWDFMFPSYWYIWGSYNAQQEVHGPDHLRQTFFYANNEHSRLNFAAGLNMLMGRAPRCNYYLMLDDDLTFRLERPSRQRPTLAAELLHVLAKYNPAVAGFWWDVGATRNALMQQVERDYAMLDARPLVIYDNGMVVFRRDATRFFFPLHPHHEGNFTTKYTLGGYFNLYFTAAVFREQAITFGHIRYTNNINIDLDEEGKKVLWKSDTEIMHKGSRHPYEYLQREAFQRFMAKGQRCLDCVYPVDRLDWRPAPATQHNGLSARELTRRIHAVSDVRYPLFSNNRAVQFADLRELLDGEPVQLKCLLFCYNRIESVQELWAQLMRALPPLRNNTSVEIHIHVDKSPKMSEITAAISQFSEHPFAKVFVHENGEHMGLRNSILRAWEPKHDTEFGVFLEDDVRVSPYIFQYCERMIRNLFFNVQFAPQHLAGVSLFQQLFTEVDNRELESSAHRHHHKLWQMPQSWGAVYAGRFWSRFRSWALSRPASDPSYVPNSMTNRWMSKTSWKKLAIRYMVTHGYFMSYLNGCCNGERLSISAPVYVAGGTNDKSNRVELTPSRWKNVSLIDSQHQFDSVTKSIDASLRSLPTYDFWHHDLTEQFNPLASETAFALSSVDSFDRCTVILLADAEGGNPQDELQQIINHLSKAVDIFQKIIVITSEKYKLKEVKGGPKLIVDREGSSSPTRLYKPRDSIETECVMFMDQYTKIPLEALRYGFHVWAGHFFHTSVGFEPFARWHRISRDRKYQFVKDASNRWSMLRPPGTFIHRKYLSLYSSKKYAKIRGLIDRSGHCASVLLDLIIAETSKIGPVVISRDTLGTEFSLDAANWRSTSKQEERDEIFNSVIKLFGVFPLQTTVVSFSSQNQYGSSAYPGVLHYWKVEPKKGSQRH